MADPIPATNIVDPVQLLYYVVLDDLRRTTGLPVELDDKQIKESLAATSCLVAACGLVPAVDGTDQTHRRVMDGLAGLEAIRLNQAVRREEAKK